GSQDAINGLVTKRLSPQSIELMSKEVADVEIKEVIWSLKSNKAPGRMVFPQ
ncbi:hypothetical protein U1Q18_037850, partial [Sarracenia purpurea var. burkii]